MTSKQPWNWKEPAPNPKQPKVPQQGHDAAKAEARKIQSFGDMEKNTLLQAALLLLNLPKDLAAKILQSLPAESANKLLELAKSPAKISAEAQRLLLGEFISEQIRKDPEFAVKWMQEKICGTIQEAPKSGGHIAGGEIFETLLLKNDAYLETLISKSSLQLLALALSGASAELKEKFFRNMTIRLVHEVQTQISFFGAAKSSDVLSAQQSILAQISR